MIQYGLISKVDAGILERAMDLVCQRFPGDTINYCEVGLYNGRTSSGVKEYLESKRRECRITGIDNFVDNEKLIFFPDGANLITGNSSEVYNLLDDESQHLIFVDGNHSFPSVIADYFCYAGKVKVGGYLCFHDSGKHIKPFTDYQRMGSDKDPDMHIAVRRALRVIGLLEDKYEGWKLIIDGADESDPAGGICVIKRVI